MKEFVDKALVISADLSTAVDHAAKLRVDLTELELKANERALELGKFEEQFQLTHSEEVSVPDPRTGRKNSEYSQLLMSQLMTQHPTWIDLSSAYQAMFVELSLLKVATTNAIEKVGELKSQARLYAAILGALE